jgi:hypothetical protein
VSVGAALAIAAATKAAPAALGINSRYFVYFPLKGTAAGFIRRAGERGESLGERVSSV